MNILPMTNPVTMGTREIAGLLGKNHADIKRSAERLVEAGVIGNGQPLAERDFATLRGNTYTEYLLNKRDCFVLVAQNSPEFTARIVDRWQELEAQQGQQFKIPQTYSEALRLCADQAEHIEQQQALIEHQRPAVEFVERYVEAKSSKSLSDVAKVLGLKPQAFIKQLAEDNVIFKRGGSWIAYQDHIDAGRFTVNTGETNGHAYVQTRIEPKGVAWLAKKYGGAA